MCDRERPPRHSTNFIKLGDKQVIVVFMFVKGFKYLTVTFKRQFKFIHYKFAQLRRIHEISYIFYAF